MNTHHLQITFGKHKGELWTRVPMGYLRWLVNQPTENEEWDKHKEIAKAELERRGGDLTGDIEISKHAIDRASLRARAVWHKTALDKNEGLYSWLKRTSLELTKDRDDKPEKIKYHGLKFIFKWGNEFPILKTVM